MESWVLYSGIFAFGIGALLFLKPVSKGKRIRKANLEADYNRVNFEQVVRGQTSQTGDRYLIIGTGSVGSRVVDALIARGETQVRAFDVRKNSRLHPKAQFIQGDMTVFEDVLKASQDVDTVYLTAAIIRYFERLPHQAQLSYSINVQGTKNVVEACLKCGVKRLIQTSSSNVTLARDNKLYEMNEESPFVTRENSPSHYGWTKVLAEKLVIDANGTSLKGSNAVLGTGCIRPCSAIFGAFDGIGIQRAIQKLEMVPGIFFNEWLQC